MINILVYPYEDIFEGRFAVLPGVQISEFLESEKWSSIQSDDNFNVERKLHIACRKLCFMWKARCKAIEAERDFYASTLKESPALFGEDAIEVQYPLEACVLFARSAMDVASTIFGFSLPDPFNRKRYDSFNSLVKKCTKDTCELSISNNLRELRDNEKSWLSFIADTGKGRSIRDKIAHQTEFPIGYEELRESSEKEYAVVYVSNRSYMALNEFLDELCIGVINGFLMFERECISYLQD
ncbi:hypothetical protein ACFL2A_05190 [Thermodesulfobacteriota bacterium]